MNNGIKVLIFLGITFAIFAPLLFTQGLTQFDFTETGQIGDTIGGITAPIIGILSILLLFYTLWEQIKFNKKQKEISADEQFKSTFFNLLQVQRDIINKISGEFTYLGNSVDDEYPKKKNLIRILRNDREFAKIENDNVNNEIKGLDFFKSAKSQLSLIFYSLNHKFYYNNYDSDSAFAAEEDLENEVIHGSDLPDEVDEYNDDLIKAVRTPLYIAYINDKYKISEKLHTRYQSLSMDKRIGLAYAYFFNKYESIGYYFRHLYNILKFIKKNEEEKIQALGENPKQNEIDIVKKEYKDYASFVQAQMSTDELLLLFYNSFTFKKAQELIIHYDLLENLTVQNLLSKKHNCVSDIKLKDKKNLFLDLIKENNENSKT